MLYSYCLPYDDGAAPNPYWDCCTLAICKPKVRRRAEIGDWVVGTGSVNAPTGDLSGHVIYAMRVDDVKTMQQYDAFTISSLPDKVPDWTSRDPRRRLGDSIYDYTTDPPGLRPSVHTEENRKTDLGGVNVLLSRHFYYFGRRAIPLPGRLRGIVKQGQGHRKGSNEPFSDEFVLWIESLGKPSNTILGPPGLDLFGANAVGCADRDRQEAEADEDLDDEE